jgi:hypothetical protein
MYVNVYMAVLLVHWLPWSCFFLSGYDIVDFLRVCMRYSLSMPYRGVS